MTKQEYISAKRAACMRYIATAQADVSAAVTARMCRNAERRADRARRTLEAIDAGTFWSPAQERIFEMLYKDYSDINAVSAV